MRIFDDTSFLVSVVIESTGRNPAQRDVEPESIPESSLIPGFRFRAFSMQRPE
jgi:hypothetical protein